MPQLEWENEKELMGEKNIIELIRALDWEADEAAKQAAMAELVKLEGEDLKLLLQPGDKGCWDGAAQVLSKIGYPRVRPVIPGLLVWIADMNWPGAGTILNLLLTVDDEVLVPHLKDALRQAKAENDDPWILWMRGLIKEKQIEPLFDDAEFQAILRYPDEVEDAAVSVASPEFQALQEALRKDLARREAMPGGATDSEASAEFKDAFEKAMQAFNSRREQE